MAEPSKLPITKKGSWRRMNAHKRTSPDNRKKAKVLSWKEADDRAKRGVNEGLNPKEVDTLQRLELSHRLRKTEQLNAVDENGNVIFKKNGTKNRVKVSNEEMKLFKDKVLTHNHPYDGSLGQGLASRIGVPLSGSDIATAMKSDAKEIRASAQGYVYSVKRPKGGWRGNPDRVKAQLEGAIGFASDMWGKDYIIKNNLSPARKLDRQGRFNVAYRDYAIKRIAQVYGFTYTRRKMN